MITSISGDLALPGRIYAASGGRGLFYVDLFSDAPATGYEAWAAGAFPEGSTEQERAMTYDFDGDGLVNLLEYAIGSDPSKPGTAPAAEIVEIAGNDYLQMQWTRPNDRDDITTHGEVSADLSPGSWTSDPADVSVSVAPTGPGEETVTIRDLSPFGGHMRRFLRARICLSP
jgi:hypothetical protein